jgi:hypothetical protein
MGLLAVGLQASWGYSLLGPSATYPGVPTTFGDAWQQEIIGFDPIAAYNGAPPYIGPDALAIGPKNLGEGYRRNTSVIYYSFDQNFSDYFGANGEQAVVQAFAILNTLTNVDSYSSNLTEFPLQSQSQNYQATVLGLRDLKSTTLALMMEQMGLADAIRYTWVLHNRQHVTGSTIPCPAEMDYLVTLRNYAVGVTPLNQLQYSPYVNGELYTYYIPVDLCDQTPAPPDADAVEVPADPLTQTAPVASGGQAAAGALQNGFFYTGLTLDDVAGLRALMSSNNVNQESVAPGSTLISGSGGSTFTNLSDEFTVTSSNLTTLVLVSATNNPTALLTLYPNLVITSVKTNQFSGTYTYTFGNIYTNTLFTNTPVQVQIVTTNIGPMIGHPINQIFTNITTSTAIVQSNLLSGDFLIIPTNTCGLDVLQVLATNVTAVTNTLATVTNIVGASTNYITTNFVIGSTNYTLLVAPCEFLSGSTSSPTNGAFEGIERVQFVRVSDANIDPLTGNYIVPVTNSYSEMVVPAGGGQATIETFQRVLTHPDVLFSAADLLPGPSAANDLVPVYARNINFNLSSILPGLAGPGTIEPSTTVTFDKVGPVLENLSPAFLSQAASGFDGFVWGSFDGSTNDPILYPNGTSIATLEGSALIQISPTAPTLPAAVNGQSYSVTLSATGGQTPYTWQLASFSPALPTNLTLSSGGVISGTPNESGTFQFTVQMNDAQGHSVQMNYLITIH